MKAIDKRIAALEAASEDNTPYVAWQYGSVPPDIPNDIGDRPVMIVRWAIVEPPVRDADDMIIEPAQAWHEDDPRYREIHNARASVKHRLAVPFDPASARGVLNNRPADKEHT